MEEKLWVPFDAWKARPSSEGLIALLEASRPLIYNLCHQVLRHPQDAEDASQLVLLALVEKLGELRDTTHCRHWIYRASLHAALNLKRSQKRRTQHEREKAERGSIATPALPTQSVHEHLANLDAEPRALLISRYFERRSVEDLAASSGCSTVTLWKRLEKAREELLQSLVRSGLLATLPDLGAILDSSSPAAPPSGLLSPSVLAKAHAAGAGSAPLVSLLGVGAWTLKSLAVVLLVGLAGAGLLALAARRHLPPLLSASSRHPEAPGTLSRTASAPSPVPLAGHPGILPPPDRSEIPAPGDPPELNPAGSPLLSSIISFMKMQNEDGSWGDGTVALGGRTIDRTGVTSLAVLAFLGAGYSQLSKDEYEKRVAGNSVRRALSWLLQGQREDGRFATAGDPSVDQAIASLALCEAYGMTASRSLKEPAERAIQALSQMQAKDGSWGNATATYWAREALTSAELGEVGIDADVMSRARSSVRSQLDAGPDLTAMTGYIFLTHDRTHPALGGTSAWISSVPPDPGRPDLLYCYMGSLAMFQYHGPGGEAWKVWSEPLRRTLLQNQQEGFWPGTTQSQTVVQSSLATLSLEVLYRYANLNGSDRPGEQR